LLFQSDRDCLEEHKKAALQALRDIAGRGYFGYAGIDAMLYRSEGCVEPVLYPIVEINARQTMSLAVLRFQKKAFPHSILKLSYQRHVDPGSLSIVPDHLMTPQKKVIFNRQLTLQEVM
jgi:predicted ATP-grasp superfamily ATP-dependent carboligase